MNRYKIVCYLLFALIIVYFSQGLLYPIGSIISQSSLALYIAICMYYFIKVVLKRNNNTFIISIAIFMVMIAMYYVFSTKTHTLQNFEQVNTIGILKNVLFSMGTFFPFYYMSVKNKIQEKDISYFFIIYSALVISRFFYFQTSLQTELSRDNIVNNAAYDILSLFPFVFLIKGKKLLSNSLILFFFLIILLSFKRGAIVTASVSTFIYFLYFIRVSEKSSINVKKYISILATGAILAYLTYDIYMSNEFLQERIVNMLEGSSSGRDSIYSNIFNYWINSKSILNLIFGYGISYSVVMAGNVAHNDWLELLSNCGLLGVTVYFIMFYQLYRFIKKTNCIKTKYMLITIASIWLLKSLFSMGYMDMGTAPLMMLLGFYFGKEKEFSNKLKRKLS